MDAFAGIVFEFVDKGAEMLVSSVFELRTKVDADDDQLIWNVRDPWVLYEHGGDDMYNNTAMPPVRETSVIHLVFRDKETEYNLCDFPF